MRKPYKPDNRKLWHVEKAMPGRRRRKGYHYVAGAPGLIGTHWCLKRMPKGEKP